MPIIVNYYQVLLNAQAEVMSCLNVSNSKLNANTTGTPCHASWSYVQVICAGILFKYTQKPARKWSLDPRLIKMKLVNRAGQHASMFSLPWAASCKKWNVIAILWYLVYALSYFLLFWICNLKLFQFTWFLKKHMK